ncbi:DUF6265 family protein [Tenacibaculum retecalamus]|uniref:DUF6265 family protein n=1 Tax=Tenacibaculum retecalamus TaxID=3018315 RepID=UPI0023D93FB2|nr:DUF6265 family protein [Tenacibaculum retecalamus]WBX71865.1 DUF6265 family protein [Tenacibaculum retecalamus]
MKNYFLLFFIISLFSCKTAQKTRPNWLVGKWERVNEKPDKSTFDFWNKDLTAIGFTLKNSDTIFKEIMSIVTIKDTLHLKVEGVNEKPTLFKFTQQTDTSFVCENQKNEFPKKIHYFLDKQQLKCKISNEEFSIDFVFDRTE